MKLPIVADYRDLRAEPRPQPVEWQSTVGGLVAALLGAVAPALPPASALLEQLPWGPVIIRAILVIVTSAIAVHVLSSVVPAGLTDLTDRARYRYQQGPRIVAKWLTPGLIALSIYRVYEVLPNGLMHRKLVTGFICNGATDMPVAGAHVVVRSSTGAAIGESPIPGDGYVIVDIEPWALKPWTIEVVGSGCVAAQSYHEHDEGTKCPNGDDITTREPDDIWRMTCKPN